MIHTSRSVFHMRKSRRSFLDLLGGTREAALRPALILCCLAAIVLAASCSSKTAQPPGSPGAARKGPALPTGMSADLAGVSEDLTTLFRKNVLNLASPQQDRDVDQLLEGLEKAGKSGDAAKAARVRLLQCVMAAKIFSHFELMNERFLPRGLLPQALQGDPAKYAQIMQVYSDPNRGLSEADQARIGLPSCERLPVTVVKMGRKLGLIKDLTPEDLPTKKDHLADQMPEAWKGLARQVNDLNDKDLGGLAREKSALLAYASAWEQRGRGFDPTPAFFAAIAKLLLDYGDCSCADDAGAVAICRGTNFLGDIFRRGGTPNEDSQEILTAYGQLLGVSFKDILDMSDIRLSPIGERSAQAVDKRLSEMEKSSGESPWIGSVQLAASLLKAYAAQWAEMEKRQ